MTLQELNGMGAEEFVASVGWVFEDSPWVAERTWHTRPFSSFDSLVASMTGVVERATRAEQLALLQAHPDLGTRAKLSDASAGEQARVCLDRLLPEEHERLMRMNEEYKSKFGFPFLYAVKGSSKLEILAALTTRLGSAREVEFRVALKQVYRIARFRLEEIVS